MTLGPLSPERLGAEGLARRELGASPLSVVVAGYELRPAHRAILRLAAAMGGSCPRAWLDDVLSSPAQAMREMVEFELVEPLRAGNAGPRGHRIVLTPLGLMVASKLPEPPAPRPHPLREALARRPEPQSVDELLDEHRRPAPELPDNPCREEGCVAAVRSRGWCGSHYMRRYRRGEL